MNVKFFKNNYKHQAIISQEVLKMKAKHLRILAAVVICVALPFASVLADGLSVQDVKQAYLDNEKCQLKVEKALQDLQALGDEWRSRTVKLSFHADEILVLNAFFRSRVITEYAKTVPTSHQSGTKQHRSSKLATHFDKLSRHLAWEIKQSGITKEELKIIEQNVRDSVTHLRSQEVYANL
jgi:hypothetical protein